MDSETGVAYTECERPICRNPERPLLGLRRPPRPADRLDLTLPALGISLSTRVDIAREYLSTSLSIIIDNCLLVFGTVFAYGDFHIFLYAHPFVQLEDLDR